MPDADLLDDRSALAAFAAEALRVEATLGDIDHAQWPRPALGEWTVAELVAHLVRAADRVDAYLDQPLTADAPACDRISYWRVDLQSEAPAIARRAREQASSIGAGALASTFAAAWRRSHERARSLPADHLVQTIRGPMALDEYVATRVLELVVHHLDLRRALDLPPSADPRAARIVAADLEALLGGPRPRNLGRDRFLLVATGRLPSDDPRFPLLR